MHVFAKRLVGPAVSVVVCGLLLELGGLYVYPRVTGGTVLASDVRQRLAENEAALDAAVYGDPLTTVRRVKLGILHPYIGAVNNPEVELERDGELVKPFSRFGFLGEPPPFEDRPEELVVAISGGSVAGGFYRHGRGRLEEWLRRRPEWSNKTIRFVSVAMGGHKQPQQLSALSYYLLRGAEFDIWINLDGFNDIVLPVSDNLPNGVALDYPRFWHIFARRTLNSEELTLRARLHDTTVRRERIHRAFDRPVLRHSAFWVALWDALDRRETRRFFSLLDEVRESLRAGAKRAEIAGPALGQAPPSEEEARARSLRTWASASRQMAAICDAHGIRYFHFLQPNQYVVDSKPFSSLERENALIDGGYREHVELGYPLLKAYARDAAAEGFPIYDLTGMFADEERTVYIDTCCHMNELGNELMADAIGRTIIGLE